jgi:hypothetical protein
VTSPALANTGSYGAYFVFLHYLEKNDFKQKNEEIEIYLSFNFLSEDTSFQFFQKKIQNYLKKSETGTIL